MGKIIVLFISVLCMMASCTKDSNMARSIPATPPPVVADTTGGPVTTDTSAPRSFLALGDSYTIGQSVAVNDRFPVQTARYLTAAGVNFGEPEIIAQTGWTTANLLRSMLETPPMKTTYDVVTLLIGVNNQYQLRSPQEYSDEFTVLLNKSIAYAGNNKKRVVVLSIPDYSVTPFASNSDKEFIAKQIDLFNAINKTIALQAGVNYVDITGFTRYAASDPSLIATDGLHPSGIEYTVWAKALVPVIKAAVL